MCIGRARIVHGLEAGKDGCPAPPRPVVLVVVQQAPQAPSYPHRTAISVCDLSSAQPAAILAVHLACISVYAGSDPVRVLHGQPVRPAGGPSNEVAPCLLIACSDRDG